METEQRRLGEKKHSKLKLENELNIRTWNTGLKASDHTKPWLQPQTQTEGNQVGLQAFTELEENTLFRVCGNRSSKIDFQAFFVKFHPSALNKSQD